MLGLRSQPDGLDGNTYRVERCRDDTQICVDLGRIVFNPESNDWGIEPAVGPEVRSRFQAQGNAELALLDHQIEAWQNKAVLTQEQLAAANAKLAILRGL